MLKVHHLERSASERVIWLLEELEHPYQLERYRREPTLLAPPEYKALHPLGAAPVIEDDGVVLAESGAIVSYVLGRYGNGRLTVEANEPQFARYLYWFHFANGTLQPSILRALLLKTLGLEASEGLAKNFSRRLTSALEYLDASLSTVPYLAGERFTAADIMIVFSLTTMRSYHPIELEPYPHVEAYLRRIGARPGYRRAMSVANPIE